MHRGEATKPAAAEPGRLRFPEWQLPLQRLILEFDRATLNEQMQLVEALVRGRLQQLHYQTQSHTAEHEALRDAVSLLRVFKRETLDFPDWK